MGPLVNLKDEEFCRLVACGMSRSDALRQSWGADINSSSIWSQASRKARDHGARIVELRAALSAASSSDGDFIASKTELMQYLTRAIRTPLSEIDEDSDLAQEVKITETETGSVKQVKAINKLGAAASLASVAQYTAPSIGSIHITNNITPQASLSEVAASLAEKYRLLAPSVVEAELVDATPQKKNA